MDGTGDIAIFKKDYYWDDCELGTINIYSDVSMKKSNFNDLVENCDNNLDNEWDIATFLL